MHHAQKKAAPASNAPANQKKVETVRESEEEKGDPLLAGEALNFHKPGLVSSLHMCMLEL